MYKLMVVAGPNRGSFYPVKDGENPIGRQSGNAVVLQSSRVSKRHCMLVVNNDRVEVQDQGSSNGTFVNGVLAKTAQSLKPGDKITVGEFTLELVAPPAAPKQAPHFHGLGNVLQFPAPRGPAGALAPQGVPAAPAHAAAGLGTLDQAIAPAAPTDLKGRLLHAFESSVMPFFYGFTMKNEVRVVTLAIFGIFLVANVFVSVSPLLDANRESVIQEVKHRATFMARQIAETNAGPLAAKAETKTEIGLAGSAENVRLAMLTDLENRIIAPSEKSGQHLAAGVEARIAHLAGEAFRNGREVGIAKEADDSTVVAVEPVKILSPQLGRNIVIGMAVVSIDTSQSTLGAGDMGNIYSKTLVFSAVLAGLVLLIVYRLVIKPFQVLNEDMDKALKGEIAQVTHEFKFEEMDSLWDLINSALQRIPKGQGGGHEGASAGPEAADYVATIQAFAAAGKLAATVLDGERKVVAMNEQFADVSGFNPAAVLNQEISAVARDQSIVVFINDLLDRATPGSEGVSANYDFNTGSFRVQAFALGKPGEAPRCYVLVAAKNE